MDSLITQVIAWPTLLASLLMFGFAPGAVLRMIVLAFRGDDPRRTELLAELPHVPRIERPFWVCEQLEVALFEGLAGRVAALITRKRYSRRSAQELGRAHMPLNVSDVTPVVRNVSGLEHADILAEALSTARRRLLIISPFAANAVVNRDFITKLKHGLRTGVEITIACGYGEDNSYPGKYALRRLSKLATRYDGFTFARIENLHAKILICDSTCVSTSYNWLSSRSDSNQSCWIEAGTLEIFTDRVDERYARCRSLVDEKGILCASQNRVPNGKS